MSHLRASLPFALLAASLFGCSDPTPAPTDVPPADAASDTPADNTSADVTADAPTDAGADASDAAVVSFVAMTTLTTINQNCMPVVARDPLTIMGSVAVTNTGTAPIGPITINRGLIVALLGGQPLAGFNITPVTIDAIAPRATGTTTFTKAADSLGNDAGTTGCEIVPCGSPIRVSVELSGANIPAGSRAASEPGTLPCTH